ncbi:MAG: hypothetical protein WDA75_09630 [Candidatus Latescibacterota bacterium]|jgi:hypothetical protein
MAKTVNDGLARLQSESRISARTWRQWCTLLKIDPTDAVDVWEEICYPVMLASRRVPDVPFILQLRAARPELDVFDLKEEVPKILHFASLLSGLHDQRLTAGKVKSSLLAYYRLLAAGPAGRRPSPAFLRLLLVDLCSALLVSKILPAATITFSGVLKPVVEGKGSLEQVVRLGLRAVSSAPYGAVVRDSLGPSAAAARQEALAFTPDSLRRSAVKEDEEDEEKERGTEDQDDGEDDEAYERGGGVPADDADADRDEAEADQEEGDEEDEGEDGTPARVEDETDREDTEAEGETDDDDQDEESEEGDENEEVRDEADDHDQNDPDDRERDDDAEEAEPAASRIEVFLLRFKTALHAVYEAEAKAAGAEEQEQAETLLEDRLRAITLFRPLVAAIPSLEEAQAVVRRAETKTRVVRTHRAVLGARPSAPVGATGEGGGAAPTRTPAPTDRPAVAAKGEPARRPPPPVTAPRPATSADTRTGSLGAGGQVEVAIADMVEPERLSLSDVNEKAHQIGRLLAALEPLDQTVWGLFLDPTLAFKDVRGLARLLAAANSPTARAGQGIRQIASLQSLQELVRLPDQLVRKDRSFMVEISTFVNGVNNNRVFEADSRQLSPLKRILDHAIGALFRLEVLRINLRFWREHPDDYTAEAVISYCEEALRLVTDQWNPELRRQIRQKADGDTTTMLQTFAAERFIEQLVEGARVYARELKESGQTRSLDEVRIAMAGRPLVLPAVEAPPVAPGEVPADLLVSLGLGEVLDELSRSVISQVWPLMQPAHQPANTARRIQAVLRESLASTLVLSPERKRHYETSHLAMPVASLDKITGNPSLMGYYVRLRDDGRVAYLEEFEDGTFVDVFELKEHKFLGQKPAIEKAEKEEIPEEEDDEAQSGERQTRRKYLFTVGRTNRLFAATPSDLINGCIKGTGGGPRIWPRVVGGKSPK